MDFKILFTVIKLANVLFFETAVRERLINVKRQAGSLRQWSAVRLCSSLLFQLVDSISPFITTGDKIINYPG